MNKPHKHREYIKAWADGYSIQYRYAENHKWLDMRSASPDWGADVTYRIKPPEEGNLSLVLYHQRALVYQYGQYHIKLLQSRVYKTLKANMELLKESEDFVRWVGLVEETPINDK